MEGRTYYVYEHWLFNRCIYVGCGDKYRPFDFLKLKYRKRNKEWQKLTDGVEHMVEVKIVGKTTNKENAIKIETIMTMKRIFEGHCLTNIRIGNINKKGENSPMFGDIFSKEQIENIRKAQIKYTRKYGSQFKGKHHNEETKKVLADKSRNNSNAATGVIAKNVDGSILRFKSFGEAQDYFRKIIGRNSFRRIKNNEPIEKDLMTGWTIERTNPRRKPIKKEKA